MGFLSDKLGTLEVTTADDIINATLLSIGLYGGHGIGYGRGKGAKIPADYQYIPWDMLNTLWLSSIESQMNEEQLTTHRNYHQRKRILIADEGGLGKTFSACICAAKVVAEGQSVLIITPPALRETWVSELSNFQIPISPKRTAKSLYQPLEPGVAYVVSRGSIQKEAQFTEEHHSHLRDIGLVILDEAHYGMIASSVEETTFDGHLDEASRVRFKQRLEPFIHMPRQVLCLTATPMRKGWRDLKELVEMLDEDENLAPLASIWSEDDNWITKLGTEWLLPLVDYVETSSMGLEMDDIQQRLNTYAPHIPEEFRQLIVELLSDGANLEQFNRARLARDLHPLGRYFHCTVRDDLGLELVTELFRERLDKRFDFSRNNLPLSNKFGESMPKIAQACISNLLDTDRYTSLVGVADGLGIDSELIAQEWVVDPRRQQLLITLHEEYNQTRELDQPEQRGCVVFAHHVGTQLQLFNSIQEEFREVENVKVVKTYSEDEDLTNSPSRFRVHNLLRKCEKDAQDGIFIVLVCGDGLAEGQSFLWANTLVNWDLHGGAENVAQRSWRLDRMLPHNPTYPPLSPSFKIIHFVVTETDDLQQLNTTYRMNRTILGERRFIQGGANLIPEEEGEHGPEWTDNARIIGLLNDFTLRERNWAIGVGESTLEEASEQLWHRALASLMSWDDFLPDWDEDDKDILEYIPGQEDTSVEDWLNLIWCGDRTERKSLKRLRGAKSYDNIAIPRTHGPPSLEHDQELLQLLPTGRIPHSLVRQSMNRASNSVVLYNSNMWIASSPAFIVGRTDDEKMKQEWYWGEDIPSGLFMANHREGPWRVITMRELNTDEQLRISLVELCEDVERTLMDWHDVYRENFPDQIEFNANCNQPEDHITRAFKVLENAKRRLPEESANRMFAEIMAECPHPFGENEQLQILVGGR